VLVTSPDVAEKYFGNAQKRKFSAVTIETKSGAIKQSLSAETDTTQRRKALQKLREKVVSVTN